MRSERMSKIMSSYIAQELDLTAKEKDRIRFGIELLISTLLSIFLALFLAWILDIIKPVLFVLLASAILKQSSGGIHLKTMWECALFGAIITNLLGFISLNFEQLFYEKWSLFLIISTLYIVISLLLWSPADVEEKPIEEEAKRKKLKLISIVITLFLLIVVASLLYFYQDKFTVISMSVILGLLFQATTINPISYRIRDLYYGIRGN